MTNYGYSIEILVKSIGYSKFERNFLPHTINSEMITGIGNMRNFVLSSYVFLPCTGLNRILARRKIYEFPILLSAEIHRVCDLEYLFTVLVNNTQVSITMHVNNTYVGVLIQCRISSQLQCGKKFNIIIYCLLVLLSSTSGVTTDNSLINAHTVLCACVVIGTIDTLYYTIGTLYCPLIILVIIL